MRQQKALFLLGSALFFTALIDAFVFIFLIPLPLIINFNDSEAVTY